MKYQVLLKPKAVKALKKISKKEGKRIIAKLKHMENDLAGDVKKLTNHTPEFRLRVGDWRVLFEIEEDKIIVYSILQRKDAYK